MMARSAQAWDHAAFAVEIEGQPPFTIETSGGLTWTVRALIAAGPEGCVPADATWSRWPGYIAQLRAMGLPIDEAHVAVGIRFTLSARVVRAAGTEAAKLRARCR